MINLPYANDSVPKDNQEMIWGRVQDTLETLMKEREEEKDGKGKEVLDEEGFSLVRTGGSGGSGIGGSRPGFGGRIPKLPTWGDRCLQTGRQTSVQRLFEEVDTYRVVVGKKYIDGLLLVDSNSLV